MSKRRSMVQGVGRRKVLEICPRNPRTETAGRGTEREKGSQLIEPSKFFPPMKSKSGIRREFFGWQEIEKYWIRWVEPRIRKGIAVEPKIDGFRTQLHKKGDVVRIYLEESDRDFSGTLPEITKVLKKIPHSFILDAEMYSDSKKAVPLLFGLLWWDGSLIERTFKEQRKRLEEVYSTTALKSVCLLMPSLRVETKEGFETAIRSSEKYMNSEGAMLKESSSKYVLGGKESTWSKLKRVQKLRVKVLRARPVRGMKAFRYECGVRIRKEDIPKFRREDIQRGCISLGWTLNTSIRAHLDENLIVNVSSIEISEVSERGGLVTKQIIRWKVPVVKEVTPRPSFWLEDLYKAAQLLPGRIFLASRERAQGVQEIRLNVAESWTENWDTIEDIESSASASSSIEELAGWVETLEDIVSESPYYIEQQYAREVLAEVKAILDEKIQEKVDEVKAEIERLKHQLGRKEEELTLKKQELEDYKATAAGLVREIQGLDSALLRLKARRESIESTLSDLESEISRLERKLEDLSNEKSALESELSSRETRLESKEADLDDWRSQLEDLEDEISDLESELEEAEEEKEAAEENLSGCEELISPQLRRACKDHWEEEIDQADDKIRRIESAISRLEDEIREVRDRIRTLEWLIRNLEGKIREIEARLRALEEEASTMEVALSEAQREKEVAQRQLRRVDFEIDEFEQSKARAEENLAEIRAAIEDFEEIIAELERQIETLKTQIENLERQLAELTESRKKKLVQGIGYSSTRGTGAVTR